MSATTEARVQELRMQSAKAEELLFLFLMYTCAIRSELSTVEALATQHSKFSPKDDLLLCSLSSKKYRSGSSLRAPEPPKAAELIFSVIEIMQEQSSPTSTRFLCEALQSKSARLNVLHPEKKLARLLSQSGLFQATSDGWCFKENQIPPAAGYRK